MRLYLIAISKVGLWTNTRTCHTWSGQELVSHAVSNHRVLLLYYRVLGNINSCLFTVMCGCETSAILRDWKLKPWLPQGRWVDADKLTVKASVCSSGSISTSSGGWSTVSSSSGCGCNHCWDKTALWQQHVPKTFWCCHVTPWGARLPFPPFHIPPQRWDWQSTPCVKSWFL